MSNEFLLYVSSKMLLSFDETRTNILTSIFIIIMIAMLTTLIIFALVNENNDLPNAITLVVEVFIGITISVILYIYSQKQHDNNQKQGRDIKCILDNIQPLVKDLNHSRVEERKFASHMLVFSLEYLIKQIDYILQLDDKYEQATTDREKTRILMLRQKRIGRIRRILSGRIDYLNIARIFNAEAALKYDDLRMSVVIAQAFWAPDCYDDRRTESLAYWNDCVKNCEILKDIVKPDDYDNEHIYGLAHWDDY